MKTRAIRFAAGLLAAGLLAWTALAADAPPGEPAAPPAPLSVQKELLRAGEAVFLGSASLSAGTEVTVLMVWDGPGTCQILEQRGDGTAEAISVESASPLLLSVPDAQTRGYWFRNPGPADVEKLSATATFLSPAACGSAETIPLPPGSGPNPLSLSFDQLEAGERMTNFTYLLSAGDRVRCDFSFLGGELAVRCVWIGIEEEATAGFALLQNGAPQEFSVPADGVYRFELWNPGDLPVKEGSGNFRFLAGPGSETAAEKQRPDDAERMTVQ